MLCLLPACVEATPPPESADHADPAIAESMRVDARGVDKRELLRLHAELLEDHRKANYERWLANETDDYVVASRGALSSPTKNERRARLVPYLTSASFREYRDMVPPVVKVSRDGSLAWVVVQVHAEGVQREQGGGGEKPLAFTAAWIELYEKREGRWLRVGNVSNFKE